MAPILEAVGLFSGYGSTTVVRDLDLAVEPGEVVALLGPNGAGKTTTLLTLAGELSPQRGEVRLNGRPTRAACHRRARAGLGFVTEERSVFMRLSVVDNLRVAGVATADATALFPELEHHLKKKAGQLSGGQQQMLALARMLGRRPTMLLADELSLGLAPLVVARLLQAVRQVATDRGVGVLVVEQHVGKVMEIADQVYLLSQGQVVLHGTSAEMRHRLDEVEASYLAGSPNGTAKH
jgi:ABC-type branched-subunit amino acid transport system ATPase component